jgi:hypothetical protein
MAVAKVLFLWIFTSLIYATLFTYFLPRAISLPLCVFAGMITGHFLALKYLYDWSE